MIADEVVAELTAVPFRHYDDLAARSPTAPPPTHGLYAWWQVSGALPGVPGVPHPTEELELLYVGTAPRDAKSKSDLRKPSLMQTPHDRLLRDRQHRRCSASVHELLYELGPDGYGIARMTGRLRRSKRLRTEPYPTPFARPPGRLRAVPTVADRLPRRQMLPPCSHESPPGHPASASGD
jgi:hypothetical protein